MAWEWSHSVEAYQDARDNLADQNREWIIECWAEWLAAIPDALGCADSSLDSAHYAQGMVIAAGHDSDLLADLIWDKMEEQRICDNGGHNAWCCPFGCHTVSFTRGE